MIEIRGRYNTAVCYTNTLEDSARQQIQDMCDHRLFAGSQIRIMPDVHAGAGCTIGTTMTVSDKVAPGLIGVDIGCGMETVKIAQKEIDFDRLDRLIRAQIPSGQEIRQKPHPMISGVDLSALRCAASINPERTALSLGTLGGGNHFIEVDRDDEGYLYLVIHSGSRSLGARAATYYHKLGWKRLNTPSGEARQALIDRCKAEGRAREIPGELKRLEADFRPAPDIPEKFAYVEGQDLENYLHDLRIIQQFAALNRQAMMQIILEGMGLEKTEQFTTIHNYVDTDHRILRKGSVSAQKGERLLIPINMRDGALVCVGKGNPEWNCSAPHGAGRILSRSAAQNTLTMDRFRQEMEGVYTTCVAKSTLDESPMAYKGLDEILSQIGPSVEVVKQIRPVYNFKAGT